MHFNTVRVIIALQVNFTIQNQQCKTATPLKEYGTVRTHCVEKGNFMELHELGAEYLQRAEVLTNRIHELNAYLRKADTNDRLQLKQRIAALYADAAECRRLAEILINYRREEQQYEQR